MAKKITKKNLKPAPPAPAKARPAIKSAAKGQTWEEADQLVKEAASKKERKLAVGTIGAPKAIPVESHLPGVARVPKPPKVHKPLAAPLGGLGVEALAQLEIVSYHFLKLMERLAAEHGGTSAQALEDLKADIARRSAP